MQASDSRAIADERSTRRAQQNTRDTRMQGSIAIADEPTTLELRQENWLREQGRQSGSYRDLLYFLFVKRDYPAMYALEAEVGPLTDADMTILELARLAEGAVCSAELLAKMADESDIWVHYTVAKALLRDGRIQEAIALGSQSLKRLKPDTTVLNLVIKYLVAHGQNELAIKLAQSCVKINENQTDLARICQCALADEPLPFELYLDPAPMAVGVTFYIPVYNVERYIRGAIEGIMAQNYPLHEILVVDDGTPDRAIDIAMEFPVRIVRHGENKGLGTARNTAFEHATTEYLGAFDSDAFPDMGYTKYAMMEYENAWPTLAGVGGRLIEVHGTTPPDKWRVHHLSQDPGTYRKYDPIFLYGSNAVYRREAVLASGGFRVKHRTNFEDVQMCRDLHAHGYELAHMPWAVAYHGREDNLASVIRTRWNWLFWNRIEDSTFESSQGVVAQVIGSLLESVNMLAHDYENGRPELMYLDFLWLFYDTAMNARQAVQVQAVPPVEARHIQDTVLAALKRLDRHHGGDLHALVLQDVAHALVEVPENSPEFAGADWQPALEQAMDEFVRVYSGFGPAIYAILVERPGLG